jgi:hypothetical protein
MMTYQPKIARDMLTSLGVGRFNATMLIETLFMAPATTEASSPPVMLLVGHIQDVINDLGASPRLVRTGLIDPPTAYYLVQIAGSDFLHMSWYEVVREVVKAKAAKRQLMAQNKTQLPLPPKDTGLGLFGLPDVPGGVVTYGVGAYLIYRALKKRRS